MYSYVHVLNPNTGEMVDKPMLRHNNPELMIDGNESKIKKVRDLNIRIKQAFLSQYNIPDYSDWKLLERHSYITEIDNIPCKLNLYTNHKSFRDETIILSATYTYKGNEILCGSFNFD